MKIRITEDKLKVLLEAYKGEITFFSFFTNVKNFIQKLLENPTNGEPSQELKDYLGTENTKEVIEKLVDYDIIRRKCDIKETPKEATADGKSKVRFSVQYSVPKKGFKDKIHKLYDNVI